MRKYEMMVIIDPELKEEEIKNNIEKLKGIINKNEKGKIESIDEWGKRELAYEIKRKREGYYVIYYFESEPEILEDLKKELRLNKSFLRGLIVRR
ncbi:MAG: 30S ribosomal protein S6 [Candidatus Hydrothermota bacterium]|nr:MAG: 30S ribosomal protein S6 [Candidatus Hydrothermae bacterium]